MKLGGFSTLSSLNRRLATRGGPSVFKGSHERLTARAYGRAMFTALVSTLALAAAPGFSTKIDNPYWPMKPGTRWVYRETAPGATPQRIVVTVTNRTKRVASGVDVLVVHDRATEHGTVVEDTFDYYAQDRKGNVWYQGEDTTEFENGKPVSKKGSWEAGVDGAKAGIVMLAHPRVGRRYREEHYPGHAEDGAKVIAAASRRRSRTGTSPGSCSRRTSTRSSRRRSSTSSTPAASARCSRSACPATTTGRTCSGTERATGSCHNWVRADSRADH